jgi:hypothetical protein
MIQEDYLLCGPYQKYLNLVSPDNTLADLEFLVPKKVNSNFRLNYNLMCVFLVPVYCSKFAFSSLFIGSNGVYINEIKAKCDGQVSISVDVANSTMSVLVMGSDSPMDFIRGIRLCQDRLVIIYEIFLREK